MPIMTVFNLRKGDDLHKIEDALKAALTSIPEMAVALEDIDFVPCFAPEDLNATVTRIDVDLWEADHRPKTGLQELATRMTAAIKAASSPERKVKAVLRPYDVSRSGWISA
jgi:hypothetical protein